MDFSALYSLRGDLGIESTSGKAENAIFLLLMQNITMLQLPHSSWGNWYIMYVANMEFVTVFLVPIC